MPPLRPALALAGMAALAALAAAAAASAGSRSSLPLVRVRLDHRGPTIHGPLHWKTGAVRIRVSTVIPDQELTLLRFRHGYSYKRFLADGRRASGHGSAASAAMRRVFADTDFLGGADVFPGTPASFTVTLTAGTYYLGEMSGRPSFHKITVTGGKPAAPPATHAVLTADDRGFHTNHNMLPAKGTITIRNTGRQIHRLNFVPVKAGTSRAQVGAYLRRTGGRPDGPPPPFARPGAQLGTSMLSPGTSFQLSYQLPAGEYAVLSFQPDSHTGKPQTLDGLYTVLTLR